MGKRPSFPHPAVAPVCCVPAPGLSSILPQSGSDTLSSALFREAGMPEKGLRPRFIAMKNNSLQGHHGAGQGYWSRCCLPSTVALELHPLLHPLPSPAFSTHVHWAGMGFRGGGDQEERKFPEGRQRQSVNRQGGRDGRRWTYPALREPEAGE